MRAWRWCCFGVGIVIAGHAWADTCKVGNYGTLPVDMENGRATTVVKINGVDTRFALDTGAFFSLMPKASATSLELRTRAAPFGFRIGGIGGSSSVDLAKVKDFGILGTTFHNVEFMVGGSDVGYGLLGANLLDFSDVELDLAHGKVGLFTVDGCKDRSLAYWTKGDYNVADIVPADNSFDRRTFLNVTINGKSVRALLDSGAYATVLTRRAAERAGVDLNAPDVKVGISSGIGAKKVKTWMARIDSFSVGTETIQHSQMEVIDDDMENGNTDMLLGVDFLLAHHMFVVNSNKKLYFTYNGGRVFTFGTKPNEGDNASGGSKEDSGTGPQTASDYALRGEADLSRGENKAAVDDLSEAIRMAPDQADYYVARAKALLAERQFDLALADLNKSLGLDPKNLDALLLHVEFNIAKSNPAAANADLQTASALVHAGSPQAREMANLYTQLNEPAAALPLLDDWIGLHSNDAQLGVALNERCWLRALTNQMLDDALSDCRKAIRRDGEVPAYLDSLGMVQLRLGHYPGAIKAYEQAIAQHPRSAWSHYGLGLAKIRSGQTAAGDADISIAHQLNPHIAEQAAKYGLNTSAP